MAEGLLVNRLVQSSGGSTPSPEDGEFEVRFIDYDGTILKTDYVDSGNAATPPDNPDRTSEGLTFVEWNNAYTNITHDLDVGATYETTDGKTYIFIQLSEAIGLTPTIYYSKSDTSTLSLELRKVSDDSLVWSDTDDTSGDSSKTVSGLTTYEDYCFVLYISSGSGTYSLRNSFCGYTTDYSNAIYKAYIGDGVAVLNDAFYYCSSLRYIVIPNTTTTLGRFKACQSLRCMIVPNGVTTIGDEFLMSCYGLFNVVFPTSITSIGTYILYDTRIIKNIVPPNITNINDAFVRNTRTLEKVIVISSVTSIGAYAFAYLQQKCEYYFYLTSPPVITNSSAFTYLSVASKIYVPSASLATYKAATNWAAFADQIYAIPT